jgi:FMN-dependent NADH-azoreductase
MWLNQAGIQEVDELRFQPTMLTDNPTGDLAKALEDAEKLAAAHGYI